MIYFLHNPFVFGITHRLFLFPLIKVIQYYKHNHLFFLSKNRRKINDYAYNTVLPLLMEKEKDDGLYQKQMSSFSFSINKGNTVL
jgi:hypothetical protein